MDKLRIRYTQTGRAQWISHLDMMRMLQRAMNRAGIPIKYSEGFNPHAQISILLPLSVGTESLCQLADIRVREELELATLPQRLTAAMPEGIEVTDVWEEGEKVAALKWLQVRCIWAYEEDVSLDTLDGVATLFEGAELIVQRRTKRGEGPFDLLPHIQNLSFYAEGNRIQVDCLVSAAEPVVKPELLAKAVAEMPRTWPRSVSIANAWSSCGRTIKFSAEMAKKGLHPTIFCAIILWPA